MTAANIENSNLETKRRRRRGAKAKAKSSTKEKPFSIDGNNDPEKEKNQSKNQSTAESVASTKASCSKVSRNGFDDDGCSGEKNKESKKRKAPKPGEEGYLTPTQLRNARKRRATKRKKQKIKSSGNNNSSHDEAETENNSSRGSKCDGRKYEDPSTKYLSNPAACPIIQRAKQYFSDLKLPFKTMVGKTKGWRTVSKLPVRMNSENTLNIGLFKPNSHEVISIPNCTAHHPSINKAITSLQILCKLLNILPYQESDGSGYLRYITLNVSRSTKQIQLTLVWNSSPCFLEEEGMVNKETSKATQKHDESGIAQLKLLIKALEDQKEKLNINSLWVHFNAQWKHADNIFDFGMPSTCHRLWKHIFGPKEIVETIVIPELSSSSSSSVGITTTTATSKKVKLHFSPNVFRQANLDAFTNIIISIRKYISSYNEQRQSTSSPLPTCLELYGGVGTIGLSLHDLFSSLLSSDENPFNVDCFTKSVNLISGKDVKEKITYLSKDAMSVLKDDKVPKDHEVLIVDPPRKGLDEFVIQSLTYGNNESCTLNDTKLLVYVSCGFDAFQRDCDALLNSKRWVLDHVEGHILFPGSNAIETLAFFRSTENRIK